MFIFFPSHLSFASRKQKEETDIEARNGKKEIKLMNKTIGKLFKKRMVKQRNGNNFRG